MTSLNTLIFGVFGVFVMGGCRSRGDANAVLAASGQKHFIAAEARNADGSRGYHEISNTVFDREYDAIDFFESNTNAQPTRLLATFVDIRVKEDTPQSYLQSVFNKKFALRLEKRDLSLGVDEPRSCLYEAKPESRSGRRLLVSLCSDKVIGSLTFAKDSRSQGASLEFLFDSSIKQGSKRVQGYRLALDENDRVLVTRILSPTQHTQADSQGTFNAATSGLAGIGKDSHTSVYLSDWLSADGEDPYLAFFLIGTLWKLGVHRASL